MQKMYGVPYMGSKNKIAEKIYSAFPTRAGLTHFYDLFAGGCAITHKVIEGKKFSDIHVNDIDGKGVTLFRDSMNGKYKDEKRWISREEFWDNMETDPYIRFCWSFGSKGDSYIYGKPLEPWKKALHFARVMDDKSLLREMGIMGTGSRTDVIRHMDEYRKKYLTWYVNNDAFSNEDLEYYINHTPKVENAKVIQKVEELSLWDTDADLDEPGEDEEISLLVGAGTFENVESLQRLQRLQSLQSLYYSSVDYRDVKIESGSLVYCDIPYFSTEGYIKGGFNHDEFYEWCGQQKELTLVSEYYMPEDRFEVVSEIDHRCSLSATANNAVKERVFIPKHQVGLYHELMDKGRCKQLTLF